MHPGIRRRTPSHRAIVVLVVTIALLAPGGLIASAQDGTPVAPDPVLTEAPAPEPESAPEPAPVETVPEPEPVLTDSVEPAPAAPEEVVPEAPVEVVEAPVAQPIVPALTVTVAPQPTCALAPDQPAAIASAGSLDYICTDSVALSGTDIVPASVSVVWSTWAAIDGGWAAQLLPPVNPGEPAPVWTEPGLAEAWFEFHHAYPLGDGAMPTTIDQAVTIDYRVRITRATCATVPQGLYLDRSIAVGVNDPAAVVTETPVPTEPLYLTPELAPIPEPAVTFDGPLSFGEVGVTATGTESPVRPGTLGLTVSHLDLACGEWTLAVTAAPLTDDAGAALDGSQLMAVSVNGAPLPAPCDLAAGCDLASLPTGPNAMPIQSITVGVELRLPEQPDLGSFHTSLTAALRPAATD